MKYYISQKCIINHQALPTYQKWSYRVLCEHTKNGVSEYSANLPKVQLQSALWGPFIQVRRVLCEPLYIGVTEYSVSPFFRGSQSTL